MALINSSSAAILDEVAELFFFDFVLSPLGTFLISFSFSKGEDKMLFQWCRREKRERRVEDKIGKDFSVWEGGEK